MNHVSVTGTAPRPALPTLPAALPSSRDHTLSATGVPAVADTGPPVMPSGPLPSGPSAANLRTGGVFPDPASPSSASICQLARRFPGIAYVAPRTASVHVTSFDPKSAGTLTAKTPQWRPWLKLGRLPLVRRSRFHPVGGPDRHAHGF